MERLRILVDMDDTIENLSEAWVEYLNKEHGTSVKHRDITSWQMSDFFPELTAEQVYAPLYEEEFWKTVKPLKDAAKVLERLMNAGHEIYIVTASDYRTVKMKMENVLFRHFPFLNWSNVIVANDKQIIQGDVLIDDGVHNLENSKCVKFLMDAPHNRWYDEKANNMIRVLDWIVIEVYVSVLSMLKSVNK